MLTLAVQNAIPRTRLGAGTGAVTYLRTLGSTLGVAIVGAVVNNYSEVYLNPRLGDIPGASQMLSGLRTYTGTLTNSQALQPLLTDKNIQAKVLTAAQQAATTQATKAAVAQATAQVPPSTPNYSQVIAEITAKVTAQVQATVPGKVASTFNQVIDLGKEALANGIHYGFMVSVIIAVVIFVITLFLKDVPLIGSTRVSLAEGAEPIIEEPEPEPAAEADAPSVGATPSVSIEGV